MDNKKSSDSKKPLTKKVDLKSSIMDKALGINQAPLKSKNPLNLKKTIESSPFIQSLSKPVSKAESSSQPQQKEAKQKNDSSSSNVFAGAVVLVVLVALFFVLNQNFGLAGNDEKTTDKTAPKTGLNETSDEKTFLSFEERYSDCILESNAEIKDNCLQGLAIEFNNPVLCEELVNFNAEKCKRNVWKVNAIISEEIDSCAKLLTEADKVNCVKQIALNTSDKTLCNRLSEIVPLISLTEINSCLIDLAIQEKDLTVCNGIEGSMNQTCKFNTAIAISDPDLCVVFNLPTIRHDCISRIAKNNNDVSLCDRITDITQKNRCIANLS